MKHVAIILAFLLTGCTSNGENGASNIGFGEVYAIITETAELTKAACGNTEPGGECLPGALITTEDRDKIQRDLKGVIAHVDNAEKLRREAKAAGLSSRGALRSLNTAILVLQGVQGILVARGVTQEAT